MEPGNLNELDVARLQQHDMVQGRTLAPMTDAFVKDHQPMIEAIASSIVVRASLPTGIEFGDLVSWGMEGLIKAYSNYRSDKGTVFKTYAYYRIRGEMYDRIRSEWQYRNPTDYAEQRRKIQERIADVVEEALATSGDISGSEIEERMTHLISDSALVCLVSLDSVEELEGVTDERFEMIDAQHSELWEEVADLDPEERQVIEMFYVHGLKQKEIAEKMNQSRSRVCRIHMKVLEKLRRRLLKRKSG
jgi:RNA polymerase sigma factor for flagellar operon FliA